MTFLLYIALIEPFDGFNKDQAGCIVRLVLQSKL